jgi:integrase
LAAVASFFTFLHKEGRHVICPVLPKRHYLREPQRLPRPLNEQDLRRFFEAVDDLRDRAMFTLMLRCGLRIGEVEGLRFSDFYISTANEAKRLFVRDSKWRKGRAMYLTDVSLEALRAYLASLGREMVGGYVFVRNGLPMKKDFLCKQLQRIGKQVDVQVVPHRLRHTFATQLLNVGCQVTSIQRLLGHTNLNTTMTYARAFDQTVMFDYVRAVGQLESQPNGAWYGMTALT